MTLGPKLLGLARVYCSDHSEADPSHHSKGSVFTRSWQRIHKIMQAYFTEQVRSSIAIISADILVALVVAKLFGQNWHVHSIFTSVKLQPHID
jgi:hypothetical protein